MVIPREKKILVPADWPLELGGFVNVIGKLTLGVLGPASPTPPKDSGSVRSSGVLYIASLIETKTKIGCFTWQVHLEYLLKIGLAESLRVPYLFYVFPWG